MKLLASILPMMQGEAGAAAPQAVSDAAQGAAAEVGGAVAGSAPQVGDVHRGSFWLPEEAATAVDHMDWLFRGLIGLSIFCFVAITAAVVYFTWKYRARPGHHAQPSPSHNDALEITWTIIPAIICVFLFVFGWRGYIDNVTPPKHATEIQVIAASWNWTFKHQGGVVTDTELHVPVDQPVRLIMTSTDVIHSFFVPAFRIKQDVVPRRYTQVWFEATKVGEYRLYCTEYCGLDHSLMKTKVVVHEPGGYERYLAKKSVIEVSAETGEQVYKIRCASCHSTDGSRMTGPSFKGLYGSQRAIQGGPPVEADDAYLRESILDPTAKVREGFQPSMSPFQGVLKDEEIDSVILYIKSLNE